MYLCVERLEISFFKFLDEDFLSCEEKEERKEEDCFSFFHKHQLIFKDKFSYKIGRILKIQPLDYMFFMFLIYMSNFESIGYYLLYDL